MLAKKQVIKDNELVKYVYHDLDSHETQLIEEAMQHDEMLAELFYDFASLKKDLDKEEMSPSDDCIDKILSYSRSYPKGKKHSSQDLEGEEISIVRI